MTVLVATLPNEFFNPPQLNICARIFRHENSHRCFNSSLMGLMSTLGDRNLFDERKGITELQNRKERDKLLSFTISVEIPESQLLKTSLNKKYEQHYVKCDTF
ncbi:hypothetical protein TNIN_47811 [Trichonephila inaurata madagascariensis]|uniref:Uncharacterized protein n=1 Tax=Trichonephila inaurata madagascariensis TaxID=2747483 RepID=A0A8X7CJM9_9ARAC|nr:hypothetical protein TNIN_47811 [Trichonephila inaurata madagascariensis]